MKIIYKRSIIEQIMAAKRDADNNDKDIERVTINRAEYDKLDHECSQFISMSWPRFRMFKPGMHVGMVCGVHVYCEEEA